MKNFNLIQEIGEDGVMNGYILSPICTPTIKNTYKQ